MGLYPGAGAVQKPGDRCTSGRKAGVVAYDKASGKEVWASPPLGKAEHASPLVTTVGGVDQVVMLSVGGRICGVDISDGKLLWRYDDWKCDIPIPSPLVIGDGRFFITGGYGAGSAMFRVERRDGKFAVSELFKIKTPGSIIHNALLYQDHLYVKHNNKRSHKGIMCLDLEGNVKWNRGESASYDFGNMLLVDGVILNLDGKDGKLRVIEAAPTGYKVLASAQIFPGGQETWAPMAFSDGKLVLRDQKGLMKCLDIRGW